jgi:predicted metal-dependent hydrolase
VTTKGFLLQVNDIPVEVVRKDIKNFHLGVYPPTGRVRVAAPLRLNDEAVRLAVISRLPWIRRHQKGFQEQDRQSEREFVTGESHYVWGRRYLLDVREEGATGVSVINGRKLRLSVPAGSSKAKRSEVLRRWYRERLRSEIEQLLPKWEVQVGVSDVEWGIRKMKTRWGSCHAKVGRIWLNLELIKKPRNCLEYILVHELVHLLERSHGNAFRSHMERVMPNWHLHRAVLNRSPLVHEDWKY